MIQTLARRAAAAAALCLGLALPALAAYPDRPITLVIPFAAGGSTDVVGRLVAERMGAELGQQIVVQNVAGAGGSLGAGQVARAEPDGYTALWANVGPLAINTYLYKGVQVDPG